MEKIAKRPALISTVCILGYIWIVFSFPAVFSPAVKKMGDWFPAIYGLLVASSFISFIGVWHMKRWGVQLYIISFFVKQMLFIYTNDISYIGIVFSVFFIASMMGYYSKMDRNL